MKKLFAMLLCLAAVGSAFAQTPECKSAYEAAKAKDDAYNKEQAKLVINRNDPKVDKVKMSDDLLGAYAGYMEVIPLDQVPNEKGQVKPKYTKKIYDSLKKHAMAGDFINAGIEFWNANRPYPDAYNAFVIGSELVRNPEIVGDQGPKVFPDSTVGVWYYNAGNCAFNAQEFEKAAAAYTKSLDMGNTESNVYRYLIAAYQNLQRNNMEDSVYVNQIQDKIYDVAEHAYNTYGSSDTYMFNNYINEFFLNSRYDEGLQILNQEIEKNPTNGNLYNLRALFYRETNQNAKRIDDLYKAGELSTDFNTLTDVAAQLYLAGQKELSEITGDTPQAKAQRQEVKTILNKAMDIANKAKGLANGADTSRLDNVIDTINYGLETFF